MLVSKSARSEHTTRGDRTRNERLLHNDESGFLSLIFATTTSPLQISPLRVHRCAFNHIQIYDQCLGDLPLLDCMRHLAVMKPAKTREIRRRAPRRVNLREVDPALVKFVEALAIADARRDHLFENGRLMKIHIDAASEKRIGGGVQNEARGSLCSVLNRASERKVD